MVGDQTPAVAQRSAPTVGSRPEVRIDLAVSAEHVEQVDGLGREHAVVRARGSVHAGEDER